MIFILIKVLNTVPCSSSFRMLESRCETWRMPLKPKAFCVCGQDAMFHCERCREKSYCCKACQIKDWSCHKQDCHLPLIDQNHAESWSCLARMIDAVSSWKGCNLRVGCLVVARAAPALSLELVCRTIQMKRACVFVATMNIVVKAASVTVDWQTVSSLRSCPLPSFQSTLLAPCLALSSTPHSSVLPLADFTCRVTVSF